ncbi:MAG: hypothetical protein AAF320_00320 [Myxococcota bacterium]
MGVQRIKQYSGLAVAFTVLVSLLSCGNDESSEGVQELALKKGGDVFTSLGLFNGNLKCNSNKTIEDCADGVNSGGLRFESDENSVLGSIWTTLFGEGLGRSGCTFRGEGSDIKCRVSCDRISNNFLGLCSSQADGCEWNEQTSRCEKPVASALSSLASDALNSVKSFFGRGDINDMETLVIENQSCPEKCSFTTIGCTTRGSKCSSSCDRIKKEVLCRFSAGCSWTDNKCKKG